MDERTAQQRPVWMRDVRRQLHRDLLIRQAQPGQGAIQAKVHYALTIRKRGGAGGTSESQVSDTSTVHHGGRKGDVSTGVVSPCVVPFTRQETSAMFRQPNALRQHALTSDSGVRALPTGVRGTLPPLLDAPATVSASGSLVSESSFHLRAARTKELVDGLSREMHNRGFDELTRQMLTSYVAANPKSLDLIRKELKEERAAERRARAKALLNHEHVFPETMVLKDKTTTFPKAPMRSSQADLVATRSGGTAKLLEQASAKLKLDKEQRSLEPFHASLQQSRRGRMTPPLAIAGTADPATDPQLESTAVYASSLRHHHHHHNNATSVFGDHISSAVYVCQGIPITFDTLTVSSLTTQNAALTVAIVSQQNEDFGPLHLVPFEEDVAALRAAASSHETLPAAALTGSQRSPTRSEGAKSYRGSRRKQPSSEMTSPLNHSASALAPLPSDALAAPVYVEELSALHQGATDARRHQGTPLLSPPARSQGNAAVTTKEPAATAVHVPPEGILKTLLRHVDSDSEDSDDGVLHPRCIICQTMSRQRVSDLRTSSSVAQTALVRWKSLHTLSHVQASESMQQLLSEREENCRTVCHDVHALAKITEQANHDAEGWLRSRRCSPSPLTGDANNRSRTTSPAPQATGTVVSTGTSNPLGVASIAHLATPSVWSRPSHEMAENKLRWESCIVFWERLHHFCTMVQWPQQEVQWQYISHLKRVLESAQCLSGSVLLAWIHLCGPHLCSLRENFRILTFVRCTLGFSAQGMVVWSRLPRIKALGFELITD